MQETTVQFLGREDPLQYSWASLVKNLPAVWEIWVRSLGWEDPLEKGKATHSSIMARIAHRFAKSQTRLRKPSLSFTFGPKKPWAPHYSGPCLRFLGAKI